jgi:hypothetical protein
MVATDSDMRSTWRSSSCGSIRSWLNVSSCPIDLVGRLPAGQGGQVHPARLAQAARHRVERQRGQVAHRLHSEVTQALGRGRADAPERLDVVAVQEDQLLFGRHQEDARTWLEPGPRRPRLGRP